MDFLSKLDFLMKKKSINKNKLSKESGIPYTTIDGFYKKGYHNAKISTIKKLASYFDTTIDYLMIDEITNPEYGKTSGFSVTVAEMDVIKQYRLLNNEGQEKIKSYINDLVSTGQYKKHSEPKMVHHA